MVLPRAHGEAVLSARIRCMPDDFVVEEIDAFQASGVGEHLLLRIQKRGMNTAFAAGRIAAWAGVPESAVGYAGLKDRHAVTRQRFSVQLPGREAPDVAALQTDDLTVLDQARHARKLPRGALAGNRFDLILRAVAGDATAIEQRLRCIAAEGVPNYFGVQRFGHGGGNIDAALAMFEGRRMRREQRGLLLSAARSELFNRVLAVRVDQDNWRGLGRSGPLAGEVWMLDGSRSVFGPEPWSEALATRLAAFDLQPTGPLWGCGELRTTQEVRAIELTAVEQAPGSALCRGLEGAGLRQERRALRLRPSGLSWDWPQLRTLRLRFALPPGAYATVVLDALGACEDSAGRAGTSGRREAVEAPQPPSSGV